MAVIEKDIPDWKRIMLDTGVILSLFLSEDSNFKDERVAFIRKLIDYLEESNSGDGKKRTFLIPTIVITEVLIKENDQEKIKKILRVLNSSNVEFVDFDLDTSLMFNHQLYPYLSKAQLHSIAAEFGFKTNEFMMAREWITRDFMIMMSGVRHKADAILTTDKRTFYPLAQNANAFCVLAYPEYFDQSQKFIIKYHHSNAMKDNPPLDEKGKPIKVEEEVVEEEELEVIKDAHVEEE